MAIRPSVRPLISAQVDIDQGRVLHVFWHGGPYIGVGFNSDREVEVINVWDPETSKPTLPYTKKALVAHVRLWAERLDEEWPGWFASYQENT